MRMAQDELNLESRISYNTTKEQMRAKGGRVTKNKGQGKTLRLNPPAVSQKAQTRNQKIQQQTSQTQKQQISNQQ